MNHASLATISQTLHDAVQERGCRAVGRMLGHAGTTIARWDADLREWPAAALLELAAHEPTIAASLRSALAIDGGPATCEPAVAAALPRLGQVVHDLAQDLADGQVAEREAKAHLPELELLAAQLSTLLIAYRRRAKGQR